MKSRWSSSLQDKFYNRWLRSVADTYQDRTLILQFLVPSEQELALETIQMYVQRMNSGKVKIEVCPGEIKLLVTGSKEMQV